jgi:D-glycero-D-manno-heptose 1,7-bisphosphate phosphatase
LLEAAFEYDLDLSESIMIGDRWRDIDAGIAAGCKTMWIDYGYNEKHPSIYDYKIKSLYEASQLIKRWRKK